MLFAVIHYEITLRGTHEAVSDLVYVARKNYQINTSTAINYVKSRVNFDDPLTNIGKKIDS